MTLDEVLSKINQSAPMAISCRPVWGRDLTEVIDQKAWRVMFPAASLETGCDMSIAVSFQRKQDAQAAMKALQEAGINNAGDAVRAGRRKCREIMCGALQW